MIQCFRRINFCKENFVFSCLKGELMCKKSDIFLLFSIKYFFIKNTTWSLEKFHIYGKRIFDIDKILPVPNFKFICIPCTNRSHFLLFCVNYLTSVHDFHLLINNFEITFFQNSLIKVDRSLTLSFLYPSNSPKLFHSYLM